jgi:hypothetical protein
MKREYYSDLIGNFLKTNTDEIFSRLARENEFSLEQTQRESWLEEINILKKVLLPFSGHIYFEYSIPRMGQRIDVLIIIGPVIFILEFKIGESNFPSHAIDQVWDYALDLKNFHETSHNHFIAPILVATMAKTSNYTVQTTPQNDKLLFPIRSNTDTLTEVIRNVLLFVEDNETNIDYSEWEKGRYCPTPTIIEAAMALYNKHSVMDISRSDAGAINISQTSKEISYIIKEAKEKKQKTICFVTGVPGSGKTLVGLNIATKHIDKSNDLYSVFLSGNGPLVKILREALARDKVLREKKQGKKLRKMRL